ncbi:MAG: hypothetical protein IJB10_02980 [Clostridia bacterium]|nr:hypothetical protein [Clostridia bacterium]
MDKKFLTKADNVYRTSNYIIRQDVFFLNLNKCNCLILCKDIFYLRTPKRDKEYEDYFKDREEDINGKRVHSSLYIRKYIF